MIFILEMKKENKDPYRTSILDFSVELYDRKFTTKLFDNIDTFAYYINHIPYSENHITSKIFYISVGSEISLLPGQKQI